MRIAYIAPYQGPELIRRRPSLGNLALAGNAKIEMVAELLSRQGHNVVILSQGEVDKSGCAFFPAFTEPRPFHPDVRIDYASTVSIRYVNGAWSSHRLLALLLEHHRQAPFDLLLIYNFKRPQMTCAIQAMDRLNLPVVLEYEDDAFVDVYGSEATSLRTRWQLSRAESILRRVSGGIGVSPHLLSKFPNGIPKLLLRGVVSEDVLRAAKRAGPSRRNIVAFSGTLTESKGVIPLISAWQQLDIPGWELHIAGDGQQGELIRGMVQTSKSIVLRGLLNRQQNADFLAEAQIGINPHALSATPGNVFAFKIIEYLAAGLHVISTPMGSLETELEHGITYIPNNDSDTIAAAIHRVISQTLYNQRAATAAERTYGPSAVALNLHALLTAALALKLNRSNAVPAI